MKITSLAGVRKRERVLKNTYKMIYFFVIGCLLVGGFGFELMVTDGFITLHVAMGLMGYRFQLHWEGYQRSIENLELILASGKPLHIRTIAFYLEQANHHRYHVLLFQSSDPIRHEDIDIEKFWGA